MSVVEALPEDQETIETVKVPRVRSSKKTGKQGFFSGPLLQHLPLLLILAMTLLLMTINFTQPWVSAHEDNGLAFSSAAINNLRYGLGPAKGLYLVDQEGLTATQNLNIPGVPISQEFSFLDHGPTHPYIYPNHPPLLGWAVTASLVVFGFHFWAVRLVPLVFSLGTIILFYFLMIRIFNTVMARLAAFLMGTFPMMAYFGRNVCFEALVLFFTITLLTGYVYWSRTSERRWLVLMACSVVLGLISDWPMFFFAFIVFGIHWLAVKRFSVPLLTATIVPAVLTFGALFGEIAWALNGNLQPLKDVFLIRSGSTGYGGAPVSIFHWLYRIASFNAEGFGAWSQILLPLAIFFVYMRANREGMSMPVRLVIMTFLFGVSNVLAFREGAYEHAYWQQYFLPFYAMIFAWAFSGLVEKYVSNRRLQVLSYIGAGIAVLLLNWPTIVMLYSSRSGVFVPPLNL
jgi:4-amino-4-deoxy-L-arabinose transferase-like glycosyltransferase